jgi:endonuclease G
MNLLRRLAGLMIIGLMIWLLVILLRPAPRQPVRRSPGRRPPAERPVGRRPPADSFGENGNLALGNPSNATADTSNSSNYLLDRPQYALSYDRNEGGPNWVSWHVDRSDLGRVRRTNAFAPDPVLPSDWRIRPSDYTHSGYERGHLCPSADRTRRARDNEATFYMSNMLPQTADLNEQVWAGLESYCRDRVRDGDELYIVAGGQGSRGRIGQGKVNVPAECWKVVVVLRQGNGDRQRIDTDTEVIAVSIPNRDGIAQRSWQDYLTTPAQIESRTGYRFFTNLPPSVQAALRQRAERREASRRR